MRTIEQIELARYQQEILDDVRHLVKKYCRIMGWEVPELDEQTARARLFQVLRAAVDQVELER